MTAPLRRAHLWTWVVVATAMIVIDPASALVRRRSAITNNDGIRWEDLR